MSERKTFVIGGSTIDKRIWSSNNLERYLCTLDKSRLWQVAISPFKKRRTPSQTGLMWIWIDLIADHTGHDKDEIHEILKLKFCPIKAVTLRGEEVEIHSTKYLTTKDMNDYLDKISAWASTTLGLTLPPPIYRGSGRE